MATLYLIPCPIVEANLSSIPNETINKIRTLDHFIVERVRTSRRYIAKLDHPTSIDDMTFFELNKRTDKSALRTFLKKLDQGISIGMISEAGCPGVADPGAMAADITYQMGHTVVPLVGPSSILMALMASGMSGQQFSFHGYLPQKKDQLVKAIKRIESKVIKEGSSEIFMETPYKNHFLLDILLSTLQEKTMLHISSEINSTQAFHSTKKAGEWRKVKDLDLHKKPTIFIIGKGV